MVNRLAYSKQRNKTNKLVENQRNMYYKSKLNTAKGDMRKLWQILNEMSGKVSASIKDTIGRAFQSMTSDKLIADMFAESFSKTVQNLIPKCDVPLLDPDTYGRPMDRSMLLKKATSKDVYKIIIGTHSNKAPGIDNVRTADLKLIADKIASAIAHLINSSLACGLYPDELKVGLVRPIYKGGDATNCMSYRPITMLPTVDKIVEKYVSNEIHKFYNNHSILSANQFGFQPKKSTSMLLSRFTDEVNQHLNNKCHVMIIFIDYSKAFDTLRHDTLIHRLADTGVRGRLLDWCADYLRNRSYYVKVGNTLSEKVSVTEGTAQGSVLGPLHYLAYVNDMNCVLKCSVYQFADDTCLVAADKDLRLAERMLQNDFDRVCKWSHDAGLVLNAGKTKLLHVHSSQSRSVGSIRIVGHDHQCLHSRQTDAVHCGCAPLEQVSKQKYLGLIIDNRFNWGDHIDSVCIKLRAIMAKIYILRNRIPYTVRLNIYNALVESIISYGLSSYGRTFSSYLDKIYRLQVRLLKLIVPNSIKKEFKCDAELFTVCKVLPVHAKFKYHMLKEQYFRTEIQHVISHPKITRQITNRMLKKPLFNNFYGRRTSEYIIPDLINNLPQEWKDSLTPANIANILKKGMLEKLNMFT